jgi:hypothetical protein
MMTFLENRGVDLYTRIAFMRTETNSNDLTLLIPDERWFDAPPQCTVAFSQIFAPVARAIQKTLRGSANQHLMRDLDRYEMGGALPMLAYIVTRPCRPTKTEFCYDVLNQNQMERALRNTIKPLARALEDTSAKLREAGRIEAAEYYLPRRAEKGLKAVRTQVEFRRMFNQMLVIEARLFNELVALCAGGRVPGKARIKQVAIFNKRWSMLLRQLYGNHNFSALGPELLAEATKAYITAKRRYARTQRLRLNSAA